MTFSITGKRWALMRIELDESGEITVYISYDVPVDSVLDY